VSTQNPTRVAAPTRSLLGEAGRLTELAWPVVLAQLGAMLMGVVDVLMVGQLGDTALAGVMLGNTWAFSFIVVLLGAAAGLDPVLTQAFGAQRSEQAGAAVVRGALLIGLLSIPVMAVHFLAGPVLTALGEPPDAVAIAQDYAVVRSLAVLPFGLMMLLRQLLQASGKMWPGLVAAIIANVVNVLCNGMLLYGWLGVPAIGPVGTAWATVLSTGTMLVVLIIAGWDVLGRVKIRLSALRDTRAIAGLAWLSLPVAAQVGLEGWGFALSTVLVGLLGETALAAHAVALTLASVAFMGPLGMSSAAATRVGNLLGAGHPWARAGWTAIGLGALLMTGWAAAFWLFPGALASAFVDSPDAAALAAVLLPVAGGFALFDGVQVVCFGVLRGAGDTRMPAVANIIGYYCIGLPLGAWLAFGAGLGAWGLWVGIATSLGCVAGLLMLRLRHVQRRGGFVRV
jgi:MATE family multidrug resistance protein